MASNTKYEEVANNSTLINDVKDETTFDNMFSIQQKGGKKNKLIKSSKKKVKGENINTDEFNKLFHSYQYDKSIDLQSNYSRTSKESTGYQKHFGVKPLKNEHQRHEQCHQLETLGKSVIVDQEADEKIKKK